ncbi:hypothetical protein [Thiohalocapsa marina]|uniref:hypothetical protein n=1 Tax=Thiohalocapsa marina TaxID=424902 RepID=UPI0036D8EE15
MIIQNKSQAIDWTDYWTSEHARAGLFFLSWNAGAGRLLVPDSQKRCLREMRGASQVIVSRGPWVDQGGRDALELLWEDGTDSPFAVHIVAEQTDRMIPDTQQGGGFDIAVWTRGGLKERWPGRYRVVDAIPDLRPWSEQ